MDIWDKIKRAKQHRDLYTQWVNAAKAEMAATYYGERASEDTLVRMYSARSEAERLYEELFDE